MSHGSYIFWAEAAAITRQINYVIVMHRVSFKIRFLRPENNTRNGLNGSEKSRSVHFLPFLMTFQRFVTPYIEKTSNMTKIWQ